MTQMNPADKAKEKAIKKVERGATAEEYLIVSNAVGKVVFDGKDFTSETIIAALGDNYAKIREPRLIGAIIRNARNEGWIRPKGMVKGIRKERHGAWVMEWEVI